LDITNLKILQILLDCCSQYLLKTQGNLPDVIFADLLDMLVTVVSVCVCVTVKLGGMLAYTPLDEKSIQLLLGHLHDFLKYVVLALLNQSVNQVCLIVASMFHSSLLCLLLHYSCCSVTFMTSSSMLYCVLKLHTVISTLR